jgi:hypothetical protein
MIYKFKKFFLIEAEQVRPPIDEVDELDEILEDEYDSINLSKRLENRLKELKENVSKKIEVGDEVFLKDEKKGKLSDKVYDFLKSKNKFKVLKINDKGKLDIGYRYKYIREEDGRKVKRIFYFSPRRFEKIDVLDPVAQFILSLKNIEKKYLLDYPLDYLDIDEKGNLSSLSRRNVEAGVDPYKSPKRQMSRLNKILTRIVLPDYYNKMLNPHMIEIFLNKWRVMFDTDLHVEVLEGEAILEAYNYLGNCDPSWISASCANFRPQGASGGSSMLRPQGTDKFRVLTENPQIKALIVRQQGKVMGRRILFEGVQTKTHGRFEEGKTYKFLNNFYGKSGSGGKVDATMMRWARDNDAYTHQNVRGDDIFRIKVDKTCYPSYPPIDYMFVNFDLNEFASKNPEGGGGYGWRQAYGAICKK